MVGTYVLNVNFTKILHLDESVYLPGGSMGNRCPWLYAHCQITGHKVPIGGIKPRPPLLSAARLIKIKSSAPPPGANVVNPPPSGSSHARAHPQCAPVCPGRAFATSLSPSHRQSPVERRVVHIISAVYRPPPTPRARHVRLRHPLLTYHGLSECYGDVCWGLGRRQHQVCWSHP